MISFVWMFILSHCCILFRVHCVINMYMFPFICRYYTEIVAIESVLHVCVYIFDRIDAQTFRFLYVYIVKIESRCLFNVIKWRFHIYKKSHLRIRKQTDRNEPCSVSNGRSWTTTRHYFGTTTHFIGYKLFVLIDFTKNSPSQCQMISGAPPIISNVRCAIFFFVDTKLRVEKWLVISVYSTFSKDFWFFVFIFASLLR